MKVKTVKTELSFHYTNDNKNTRMSSSKTSTNLRKWKAAANVVNYLENKKSQHTMCKEGCKNKDILFTSKEMRT